MFTPTLLLGGLLAILLSGISAGWYGIGIGRDQIIAEQAEAKKIAAKAQAEALAAAAKEIAKIDVKHITIQGKVVETIRTEVQYAECKHSSDTKKMIDEAFKK